MRGRVAFIFSLLMSISVCLTGIAWSTEQLPPRVWVDAHWSGAGNCGGHVWQVDAFNSIQAGVSAVAPGGAVCVQAGVYAEKLTVAKSLFLYGPRAGVGPQRAQRARSFAANPERDDPATEAVIVPPATDLSKDARALLEISADEVTIDGFILDGHTQTLPMENA